MAEEEISGRAGGGGRSKRAQVLELYGAGVTDLAEIVRRVRARPSYVAQVLQKAGLVDAGLGLYSITAGEADVYARYFRTVLAVDGGPEEARASCLHLDRLYNYFERLGDREGQHRACVVALTGKNRARWSGRPEAAEVFAEWLARH